MTVLPVCMCVHHVHSWYLWRSEAAVGSPGTGAADNRKLPCGAEDIAWHLDIPFILLFEVGAFTKQGVCGFGQTDCPVKHWDPLISAFQVQGLQTNVNAPNF